MAESLIFDHYGRPYSRMGRNGDDGRQSMAEEYVERMERSQHDPATDIEGMPPNFGRFALPHVQTFQGLFGSYSRAYRASDEALKHSRENARYMRNDCGIMECVESRQRSTALLDWQLIPEDESSDDQQALCDELTKILRRIKWFTDYRYVLLHAIWYGRYGVQHRYGWERIGDRMYVMPKKKRDSPGWLPLNGDKLVFRYDDGRVYTPAHGGLSFPDQVGILVGATHQAKGRLEYQRRAEPTGRGLAYFLDDWERQTLAIHKNIFEDGDWHDAELAGNIHGVGIRSRIYWDWFQKQEMLAFLVSYLERSAGGIEIWTYPAGDNKALEEAKNASKKRLADGKNVIFFPRPPGMEGELYDVRVVEPGLAGIETMQTLLNDYYGHRIKRYILGQTLSSEADATGLGSGLAELHLDTLMQIIRYDASKLQETITDELVYPVKQWNFPRARDIHVRFVINTEQPNIEQHLEAYSKAYEMGARLRERDVMEMIGAAIPSEDDRVLEKEAGGLEGNPIAEQFGLTGYSRPRSSLSAGPDRYGSRVGDRLKERIDRAVSQTDPSPSDAQKESGNYRKGRFTLHGLPITIETPRGALREGQSRDGHRWSVRMPCHYGYIRLTEGRDGDHLDLFLGPSAEIELAFVVDQLDPDGRFDEHKVLLGFPSMHSARHAYLSSYEDDASDRLGAITPLSLPELKSWIHESDLNRPLSANIPNEKYSRITLLRSEPHRYKNGDRWEEEKHPRDEEGKFSSKPEAAVTRVPGSSQYRFVDGSQLPEHLDKLRIPPAWSEVKVNPDPDGSVLATGVDAKGRRQTIYSDSHAMKQAAAKFARIQELKEKFPQVDRENRSNMKMGSEEAAAMAVIMETGIRPGSDRDTKAEKKAYGATTLRSEHVNVGPDGRVTLNFTGKKGVDLSIPVDDSELSQMLVERSKTGGPLFDTNDSKLRDYVKTLDGGSFKPKDFRTLLGTTVAESEVERIGCCPEDEKDYKKRVKEVAKTVSSKLGNTPTVALQSYIDPTVFHEWRAGL